MLAETTGFAKTSWLWELQKLVRNGWEWIELQLNRSPIQMPELPTWQMPASWETGILWLVLVVLGVGLVVLAEQAWIWGRRSLKTWQRHQAHRHPTTQADPPPLSAATWLAQAQAAQQAGNFKEACRALYMSLLQRLQDIQLIREQRSCTDQEYIAQLQALRNNAQIHTVQPYQTLLETHERLCFSTLEISDQDFQQCYAAYQEILTDISSPQTV